MAEALAQAFPVTTDNPSVTLWDTEQRATLVARYNEDIFEIQNRSDIEFMSF